MKGPPMASYSFRINCNLAFAFPDDLTGDLPTSVLNTKMPPNL